MPLWAPPKFHGRYGVKAVAAKGEYPPREKTPVTPCEPVALDADLCSARPLGRWFGVMFVDCVGLIDDFYAVLL